MTNYFEETDQMYIYNSITDYQKGILDGFLEIANMVEDEIADVAEDELAEYMEDFIAESEKNELSSCTSAEESSEILAKEALAYIERVAFDEIIDRYLFKIAGFVGIDAGPFEEDYERVFIDSDVYKGLKKEYATGLMFYHYTQIKLHPELTDYQNGVIAAYTFLFAELDMSIRTELADEDNGLLKIISQDIADALKNDMERMIPENTPVLISTLETVIPVVMSSSVAYECGEYLCDKCSQEYIYYVANYSGMSDDVYEFYM